MQYLPIAQYSAVLFKFPGIPQAGSLVSELEVLHAPARLEDIPSVIKAKPNSKALLRHHYNAATVQKVVIVHQKNADERKARVMSKVSNHDTYYLTRGLSIASGRAVEVVWTVEPLRHPI